MSEQVLDVIPLVFGIVVEDKLPELSCDIINEVPLLMFLTL